MQSQNLLKLQQLELAFWNMMIRVLTSLKPMRGLIKALYQASRSQNRSMVILKVSVISMSVFMFALVPGTWIYLKHAVEVPIETKIQSYQTNLVILHVNDLDQPKPQLISTWVMMINNTESPYVMFKSIFPSSDSAVTSQLSKTFSLKSDKKLTARFIRTLKKFDFQWQGYIIVDDQAINNYNYTQNEKSQDDTNEYSNQSQSILFNEKKQLQYFCANLRNGDRGQSINQLFSSIVPKHMHTDLDVETFMSNWKMISSTQQAMHCEVLAIDIK